MDSVQANYKEEEDGEPEGELKPEPESDNPHSQMETQTESQSQFDNRDSASTPPQPPQPADQALPSDSLSDDSEDTPKPNNTTTPTADEDEDDDDEEEHPPKKQKQLSSLTNVKEEVDMTDLDQTPIAGANNAASKSSKKSKKKNNNVWVSRTTRKGKKKNKTNPQNQPSNEDTVLITPLPRILDKGDDNPDMKICLSKVYKAEKVEISDDRLTAGSTKGYRMVRATRGVAEGAWYFEIKVEKLGETGHTRLGWSTEKGDLQAPVGYDGNSFGYRDIDGSKVHKALREKYGEEGYKEGDVIGFYISLPDGEKYAPKQPHFVCFKGQRYICPPDIKEDPPKVIPESEISFFKNGVCQGVAFKDLFGGRYYPAASMYTLPNQPNCEVKFNFGPDFEYFPMDFGERPIPKPMIEVPYLGVDSRVENGVSNEKKQ